MDIPCLGLSSASVLGLSATRHQAWNGKNKGKCKAECEQCDDGHGWMDSRGVPSSREERERALMLCTISNRA